MKFDISSFILDKIYDLKFEYNSVFTSYYASLDFELDFKLQVCKPCSTQNRHFLQ